MVTLPSPPRFGKELMINKFILATEMDSNPLQNALPQGSTKRMRMDADLKKYVLQSVAENKASTCGAMLRAHSQMQLAASTGAPPVCVEVQKPIQSIANSSARRGVSPGAATHNL